MVGAVWRSRPGKAGRGWVRHGWVKYGLAVEVWTGREGLGWRARSGLAVKAGRGWVREGKARRSGRERPGGLGVGVAVLARLGRPGRSRYGGRGSGRDEGSGPDRVWRSWSGWVREGQSRLGTASLGEAVVVTWGWVRHGREKHGVSGHGRAVKVGMGE